MVDVQLLEAEAENEEVDDALVKEYLVYEVQPSPATHSMSAVSKAGNVYQRLVVPKG